MWWHGVLPAPPAPARTSQPCLPALPAPPICRSDHEAEWAALEEMEEADKAWQAQQAAEREARELALLQALLPPAPAAAAHREPTPEWAYPREQMHEWLAAQQAAAGAEQHCEAEEQPAAEQWQGEQLQAAAPSLLVGVGDAALQPFQQLPPLPSPITSATANLDATLARLLASAGNTPTGPLAKAAGRWEPAGEERGQQGGQRAEGEAVFLLEPVLPAPLGEGVRCACGWCVQLLQQVVGSGWCWQPWARRSHQARGHPTPPLPLPCATGRRSAWRRGCPPLRCAPASSACGPACGRAARPACSAAARRPPPPCQWRQRPGRRSRRSRRACSGRAAWTLRPRTAASGTAGWGPRGGATTCAACASCSPAGALERRRKRGPLCHAQAKRLNSDT